MDKVSVNAPEIGSRWARSEPHDPAKGVYNGYTVLAVTNTAHESDNHLPQVIYAGDNGNMWSHPLNTWPGSLVPEGTRDELTLVRVKSAEEDLAEIHAKEDQEHDAEMDRLYGVGTK